jgi:hypothetical protein
MIQEHLFQRLDLCLQRLDVNGGEGPDKAADLIPLTQISAVFPKT